MQRTGWGKSAVYFVATKLLRDEGAGTTVIVSPLLALMRDQIAAASRLGLIAMTINASNRDEWTQVEIALRANAVDVLLISQNASITTTSARGFGAADGQSRAVRHR